MDRRVCRRCDYEVTGLKAGPCPECGRVFDPSNRKSTRAFSAPRFRRLLGPPGWVVGIATLGAIAVSLYAYSTSYPDPEFAPRLRPLWSSLLAVWVIKLCAAPALGLWPFWRPALSLKGVLKLLGVPAAIGLTILAVKLDFPIRLRIVIAYSELEKQAAALVAGVPVSGPATTKSTRAFRSTATLGPFPVNQTHAIGVKVIAVIDDGVNFPMNALIWFPGRKPGESIWRPEWDKECMWLVGNWYLWKGWGKLRHSSGSSTQRLAVHDFVIPIRVEVAEASLFLVPALEIERPGRLVLGLR